MARRAIKLRQLMLAPTLLCAISAGPSEAQQTCTAVLSTGAPSVVGDCSAMPSNNDVPGICTETWSTTALLEYVNSTQVLKTDNGSLSGSGFGSVYYSSPMDLCPDYCDTATINGGLSLSNQFPPTITSGIQSQDATTVSYYYYVQNYTYTDVYSPIRTQSGGLDATGTCQYYDGASWGQYPAQVPLVVVASPATPTNPIATADGQGVEENDDYYAFTDACQ